MCIQMHVKKKGKMCRFSFPRPPSCRTIICRRPLENVSSEKASAKQRRNDSSHKQDRLNNMIQESLGQNMALNHQQQQSKNQGETNSHPYRKDGEQNESCNEKSDNLVDHRKKPMSLSESKITDKEKLAKLNTAVIRRSTNHREHISKKLLQNKQDKADKSQERAKSNATYSQNHLQSIPDIDARSNSDVQDMINKQNIVVEQPSAQENTTPSISHHLADQLEDQTKSQKAAKQKHVLNIMFEAMFKLDITHDTTVEDILMAAGLSQEDYEQALSNSKSSNGIILKRRPCERFINNYNPKILLVWGANMDIQYVSDPYACN